LLISAFRTFAGKLTESLRIQHSLEMHIINFFAGDLLQNLYVSSL